MPYREITLGLLVRIRPKEAAKTILAAYRKTGGSAQRAAALLGVDRKTLYRWLNALERAGCGIRSQIDELRAA